MFDWLKRKSLDKVETKSSSGDTDYVNYGSGCFYLNASTDTSPYSLLAQNKSFVYACQQKIATYIGSVPIHLYSYTTNSKALITATKPTTKAFTTKVNKIVHKGVTVKALEIVEIVDEHPLNTLIMAPQEGMSYPDWIGLITSYLLIMGNALLEIVKDGEQIKELKVLKWENIYPTIQNGKITSYQYTPTNDISRTFTPEEVIHIKQLSPGSTLIGVGNLEKCIDSATLYNYFDAYQTTLAKNGGMPGVTINVKNSNGTLEQKQKIAEEFMSKFSRGGNGKPFVTFGDIDIKSLNVPPKDMEFLQGRTWSLKTIAACMGIPEDMVSTTDSNRASSIVAINSFYQITIFPLLNKILEAINTLVVEKYYDKNAFYFYEESDIISDDPAAKADIYIKYVSAGIMSVNEIREKLGLQPIEDKEIV